MTFGFQARWLRDQLKFSPAFCTSKWTHRRA